MVGADKARPRILLVEDEWLVATEGARALEAAGAEIVGPTSSVESALALLQQSPVDAAIVDINLHGRMAFALADALDGLGLPFAFVSGYPCDIAPHRFSGRPFFEKPADFEAILAVLLAQGGRPPS